MQTKVSPVPNTCSAFRQGANSIGLKFMPPTAPSLLGVLPLTVAVNQTRSVQEINYDNDTSAPLNIDTMVLCNAEELANFGSINFFSQVDPRWTNELYGIPSLSSIPGSTIGIFGCSISDLAMLFDWYGVTHTPSGSPANPNPPFPQGLSGQSMNPGSLNYAMANYKINSSSVGSVGFNQSNDPDWAGAAKVARASQQTQVTYSGVINLGGSTQNAIAAIQNEICAGNAVILKVKAPKSPSGQHFLLAKAIALDGSHNQTILVNNPGRLNANQGEDQFYSSLISSYPSLLQAITYHANASDPAIMIVTAPTNMQFVVTDPQGRRAGFDPVANVSYAEIPGANYGLQSINSPSDPGFTPETLVQEQYFSSSTNVLDGSYKIQVFSTSGGSYYLDYRSYDSSGDPNGASHLTGTLAASSSEIRSLTHDSQPVNANFNVEDYSIRKKWQDSDFSKAKVELVGKVKSYAEGPLNLRSNFRLTNGGPDGFKLSIPASSFDKRTFGIGKWKKTFYLYHQKDTKVFVWQSGDIKVRLYNVDLSSFTNDQLDDLDVQIDSINAEGAANLKCRQKACSVSGDHDFWQDQERGRDFRRTEW